MPELPEVETVRSQLDKYLAGATILSIEIWRSGREFPVGSEFIQALVGATIQSIKRRAKLLVWELDKERFLFAHLKMTGRFTVVSSSYQPEKHDRIRFIYRSKMGEVEQLVWADMRQFGYLKLLSRVEGEGILDEYGLEPLSSTAEALAARLSKPTARAIKTVLLDQSIIAGIGNIYADEACFRAGIKPTRLAKRLAQKDRLRLAEEIQAVLRASLAQKGTSAHHYVDTAGNKGGFLALLQVYGRGTQPCFRCRTPIIRVNFRGRGTHFCASCQR
jgi:formamidopyrimidine-DNA glycosylase